VQFPRPLRSGVIPACSFASAKHATRHSLGPLRLPNYTFATRFSPRQTRPCNQGRGFWCFSASTASCDAAARDEIPVVTPTQPAHLLEKSIRLRPTHLPHWMTEAARRSNGSSPVAMTEHGEADKANVAPESNPPKSASPSKSKPTATGSEAPAKTSKKRRKVNHGRPSMLCISGCLHGHANPTLQCSMHLLQTFGKPQPVHHHLTHGILLHVRQLLLLADPMPISI
jgi:hypothetical protein